MRCYETPSQVRYNEDPAFRMLCDTMIQFVLKEEFTPSDLRDASFVASMHVQMMRPLNLTVERDRLGKAFPELLAAEQK